MQKIIVDRPKIYVLQYTNNLAQAIRGLRQQEAKPGLADVQRGAMETADRCSGVVLIRDTW
jgi:hypothetical protein